MRDRRRRENNKHALGTPSERIKLENVFDTLRFKRPDSSCAVANHPQLGFRRGTENRGFNQIKKFLRQITPKNKLHYFSEKNVLVLGAL